MMKPTRGFEANALAGVAVCAALALLTGCAARVVERGKPFVLEKKSVVVLRQGHELQARRVAVEADFLAVTGRYSGVETRIPMREVGKVVELNAFSGMMRGAAGGAALGAGAGLVMIPIASSACEGYGCFVIPMIPVITTLWGAGGGAFAGLLRGRGAAYRFEGFAGREGDKDSLPAPVPEAAGEMNSAHAPAPEPSSSQDPGQASIPTVPPAPPPASPSDVSVREWAARERVAKDTIREAYARGNFYLGADLGLVFGKMPSGPDAHAGNAIASGWAIPVHLGVKLNPRWSAGLRYAVAEMQHRYTVKRASGAFGNGPLYDYEVWDASFMHAYEAEIRWHPYEKGLFLKGSAGLLSYAYDEGVDEHVWYRASGFTASAGAGYAWNIWSITNLVAGADLVGGVSSNGSTSWMIRPSLGVTFQ